MTTHTIPENTVIPGFPTAIEWKGMSSEQRIQRLLHEVAKEHLAYDFGPKVSAALIAALGDTLLDRVHRQRMAMEHGGRLYRVDEHGTKRLVGELNLRSLLNGIDMPDEQRDAFMAMVPNATNERLANDGWAAQVREAALPRSIS